MMTTKRTAIRRRLSIRRTAHGPPWGGRKPGHGSIVAPLTATLAATVAAGARCGVRARRAPATRAGRAARAQPALCAAGRRACRRGPAADGAGAAGAGHRVAGRARRHVVAAGAGARGAQGAEAPARAVAAGQGRDRRAGLRARERGRPQRRASACPRRATPRCCCTRSTTWSSASRRSWGAGAACSDCARGWHTNREGAAELALSESTAHPGLRTT